MRGQPAGEHIGVQSGRIRTELAQSTILRVAGRPLNLVYIVNEVRSLALPALHCSIQQVHGARVIAHHPTHKRHIGYRQPDAAPDRPGQGSA